MNPDVFFKNFELLADAPNGIQKLRELILQLAVRGKLVPQDPNDEPANVLLERIKAEKKKLVKGNSGRNPKNSDTAISGEIFNIPSNWIWTKLDTLGTTQTGTTPSKSQPEFFGNYIPFIKPADMSESGVRYDNEMLSELGLNSGRLIPKNSVLMVCIGGSIGKTCLVDRNVSCNQQINTISPFSSLDYKFITFVFKSRYFQDQVMEKASIGTLPIINKSKWEQISVPLPPLAEQKRIVSKVDELMALCDKLEAHRQKKQEIQSKLNSAVLDRMLSAENQEEFEHYWQRICENFDLLYDNPENVEKLKQAILQLAVQGKLVPQNPDDEPTSVLIENVERQKRQPIKKGKIKKVASSKRVSENEFPFELPKNWIWMFLGDVLLKLTDGTHHSPTNEATGDFKYITAKNIKTEGIDLTNITYVTSKVHQEIYSRCDPEFGDILYIKDGATTGITAINDLEEPFSMLSSVALMKLPSEIDNKYLLYTLRSPYFYSLMRDGMSGVAITRVTLTKLNNALVPVAPLAEQKRIVEKVEQLMGLCDELEAKLRKQRENSEKLMEAVVKGLLEGATTEKREFEKPIPLQAAVVKLK